MKSSFDVLMNFFRKIHQFFISDFLHSKFPKRRRISGISRAVKNFPEYFLSNAPTLLIMQQLLKNPTYAMKKVHFTFPQKTPPSIIDSQYSTAEIFLWDHYFPTNNPKIVV